MRDRNPIFIHVDTDEIHAILEFRRHQRDKAIGDCQDDMAEIYRQRIKELELILRPKRRKVA